MTNPSSRPNRQATRSDLRKLEQAQALVERALKALEALQDLNPGYEADEALDALSLASDTIEEAAAHIEIDLDDRAA